MEQRHGETRRSGIARYRPGGNIPWSQGRAFREGRTTGMAGVLLRERRGIATVKFDAEPGANEAPTEGNGARDVANGWGNTKTGVGGSKSVIPS